MIRHMLRYFTLSTAFVLLVFSSACGPVYSTSYNFLPPETPEGRTCIFQCENSKLQCQQIQDLNKERCEYRAELEYDRCKDREEKHCYRSYCSSDYSRCDQQYRFCFQACGGKVTETKVCTAFCEGAK